MNTSSNESAGSYAKITVSDTDIRTEGYKRHFGGGKEKWESRGAFQLFFLKEMGLRPEHRFLDIGCGPLRAGVHMIRFLESSNYHGIDYNGDFIKVGQTLIAADPSLEVKHPKLRVLQDFNFAEIEEQFDFALAFSVLNHCPALKRDVFLQNLPTALAKLGRMYLTHAGWFKESQLSGRALKLTRILKEADDISPKLDLSVWGWPQGESIFPIVELTRC